MQKMNDIDSQCPCTSGNTYKTCCRRFHEGVLPENALELMRSRFAAYALNLPDYIIETTHPASPEYSSNKFSWKRSISKFSAESTFQKLDILDFKENRSLATVTFVAHLIQGGHDATFTEKSYFEKIRDRWFYRGGQLAEGHAPNLVTVGQLRLLPLAYYGEPILRKNADFIEEITPEIKHLVDEMIETMDVSDGVGLAAPQVHHSIRLFILRVPVENKETGLEFGDVQVFINPEVISKSEETWKREEGCLSIPGLRAGVERPNEIAVSYTNLDGVKIQENMKGMMARVFLHENDHINGVLFVDHVDPKEREAIELFLQNLQKKLHGADNRPL